MATTIFERLGGFGRVRCMVATFYSKVSASPALGRHMARLDLATLIDHQTRFLAAVTGGPVVISDQALRRAHAALGISRAEFAEIVQLLGDTLEEHEVASDDIDLILRRVQSKERLISATVQPCAARPGAR